MLAAVHLHWGFTVPPSVIVGVWILGILGTGGGPRTDVLGHCAGLIAGIAVGVRASRDRGPAAPTKQIAAGVLTVVLLIGAWVLARWQP